MALLKGNAAAGNGGALYVDGSPGKFLPIDSVRATHNSAGGSGGAIFGSGLAIRYSTIADNRSGADGGGIALSGTGVGRPPVVDRLREPRALSGGGIHTTVAPASGAVRGRRDSCVGDSTIANNRAGADGGGIAASGGHSTDRARRDTVARNAAGRGQLGGGLYQGGGDAIGVRNTIVALNLSPAPPASDCFAASSGFGSLGHNLIGDADGCLGFGAAGDLFGGRLALGKLADNGGAKHWTYGRPLQTIALGAWLEGDRPRLQIGWHRRARRRSGRPEAGHRRLRAGHQALQVGQLAPPVPLHEDRPDLREVDDGSAARDGSASHPVSVGTSGVKPLLSMQSGGARRSRCLVLFPQGWGCRPWWWESRAARCRSVR